MQKFMYNKAIKVELTSLQSVLPCTDMANQGGMKIGVVLFQRRQDQRTSEYGPSSYTPQVPMCTFNLDPKNGKTRRKSDPVTKNGSNGNCKSRARIDMAVSYLQLQSQMQRCVMRMYVKNEVRCLSSGCQSCCFEPNLIHVSSLV